MVTFKSYFVFDSFKNCPPQKKNYAHYPKIILFSEQYTEEKKISHDLIQNYVTLIYTFLIGDGSLKEFLLRSSEVYVQKCSLADVQQDGIE